MPNRGAGSGERYSKGRGAGSGERYPPLPGRHRLTGFTLIEVIVVISILGLMVGITGLAFSSLRAPRSSAWDSELRRAREAAILSGRPVRAVVHNYTRGYRSPLPAPLFLPDGRAVGSAADPLTGAPTDAQK
jgi:prepilin-type N-terminal cleavage/methylation domain-containing protein